jgi:CHAT domain-containing protein
MVVTLLLPLTLSPHPITKEAAKPGIGRAEAHRRAMMALIDDTDHPHYAHPLFWAPFVVVGEGGSALH